MIRNLIFDWSGTLVDDLPAVWKATNHVLSRARIPEMSLDKFRAEFCLPFATFYDRHIPHVPLPQLESWYHSQFQQMQDSVREPPHAREFLEFCRARKLRAFLLSSVHRDHFAVQSARMDFGKFFEATYVQVRDKRAKIHEILRDHNLEAKATLFVGDMQHDIETARLGGIHACAVLTGYNTLEQLRASDPDLVVEHLGELRRILEQEDRRLDTAEPGDSRLRDASPQIPVATVGALIFNASGEVLMIRTGKWSDRWGIPGGKIKWGEASITALCREIKEETNLEVTDIDFVLVQDCIRPAEFYREAHFILLNYTCRVSGENPVRLNEEASEFCWAAPEAALSLALNRPTRKLLLRVLEQRQERKSESCRESA